MRDPKERLRDILDAIDRIERYTTRGRIAFERDELIQVWIIHHLQVIGEAAAQLAIRFVTCILRCPGRRLSRCVMYSSTSILGSILTKSGKPWNATCPPSRAPWKDFSKNWKTGYDNRLLSKVT